MLSGLTSGVLPSLLFGLSFGQQERTVPCENRSMHALQREVHHPNTPSAGLRLADV